MSISVVHLHSYTVPRSALQCNSVQRRRVRSGKHTDVHEGRGSARAIPSRKVVGKEEAFEHSPQEQHDHQYHEHL